MATARPVRYLTLSDIETLAFELAERMSGQSQRMAPLQMLGGGHGAEVLRGILELPRQSALGEPAYPTIFDKAAVLLRSIALDHPFVDGNKRMALATAMVFLSVNGWLLRATDDELRDFTLDVVTGRVRQLAQIAEWLELKSVVIDEGNTQGRPT